MKILSLFDGISIAQQAFKELGFEVEYYASEIDKQAIQITQKNHPNTIQLGDIKDIDCTGGNLHYGNGRLAETDIYFLIGGSPCQDLSIAKKDRKGLSGERSGLFWEYVRILKELKPKYFILENVASMPKEAKDIITETLWGIEPIMIDASLFSAQQRKRLFWVGELADKRHIGHWNDEDYNKVNIPLPTNKGIQLKDIIESGEAVKEKAYCLTAHQKDFINDFIKRHQGNYVFKDKPIRIASIGKGGQGDRIYSVHGKSVCLSANGGGRGAKTGLCLITGGAKRTREGKGKTLEIRKDGKSNALTTVQTDSLVVLKDYFRPLTPIECERLQSLPDNYTEGLSKTARKKALGNGFNCAVIKYIIGNLTPPRDNYAKH
jgi:DNA (cytosine-5)-methyltransferase 3A